VKPYQYGFPYVYSVATSDGVLRKELSGITIPLYSPTASTSALTDIDSYDYKASIEVLVERGVVQGYSDGTYRPASTINRAEFLKILMESLYPDQLRSFVPFPCFSDISGVEWYAPYVCLAQERGIISGYPDGTFQPAKEINIVEALKIVLGAFNKNINTVGEVWYSGYVDFAKNASLYLPEWRQFWQNITRGEMAELIYRLTQ
jgi:hypothetical protein